MIDHEVIERLKICEQCCDCLTCAEHDEAIKLAISALKERENRSMNWISVKERMPQDDEDVLVYRPAESFIDIAAHRTLSETYAYWSCSDDVCNNSEVTHWMPLPEPPKEET